MMSFVKEISPNKSSEKLGSSTDDHARAMHDGEKGGGKEGGSAGEGATESPSIGSPPIGPSLIGQSGFRPLEVTPQFLNYLSQQSLQLESASAEEILAWGVEHYAPYLTMATAFGPEGCVILSMLARIAPETYVFNLDTGYQFQQTLDLRDRIARKYGIEVDMLQPELTVPEYEVKHGGPLYKTDPGQCCFDRKIKLLRAGVQHKHAWMSGIRRDQSADRARAPIVGWDRKFNLVKISPLANWTKQDVWKRILGEKIPYNPLHDQGYPSIGCWPCTRAIVEGENDDRSGRWSETDKTECGLHTSAEQDGSGI
jgi:phosphoadenosine phosphosulfate reductase